MNMKIVLACFLVLLVLILSIFLIVGTVDRSPPKKSQHYVIISFDDNPIDYLPAIGIMKEYGFAGGVACVIVTQSSISTLKTFADAGWEIASHSMNHPSNMTSLSDSQLDYEIRQSKVTLEQELPECAPVITFAYPWNNFDERVESVVTQYYKYGRTAAGAWARQPTIWNDLPSALVPGLAISATNYQTDLPTALSALQNTTEGTLVLVFHAIGGLDNTTFRQSLQIIKNAQVPVVTFKDISQVYESRALLSDGLADHGEVGPNIILESLLPLAVEAWVKAEQPND